MKTSGLKQDTPVVFFKDGKFPARPAPANAVFIRDMGELKGKEVVEIKLQEQVWLVCASEIETEDALCHRLAGEYRGRINAAAIAARAATPERLKVTQITICEKLGVSAYKFRQMKQLIEDYPKP